MNSTQINPERISQTEHIVLNAGTAVVFPLFGAYEEKKWAEGWEPVPVYPKDEIITEGTTFTTENHAPNEADYIWRVNKLDNEKLLIQYLVMAPGRYWTITVHCRKLNETQTQAEITYEFTGVDEVANQQNVQHLNRIYEHRLKDWEQEINAYLAK